MCTVCSRPLDFVKVNAVPPYIIPSRCAHWFTDNSLPERTVTSWIRTSSTPAEMNAKLILALALVLQASVSFCEIPAPSQELVQKYESLRDTFYSRLRNAYSKLQTTVGENEQGQNAQNFIESLKDKPELQAIVKVASGLGAEARPLVDRARTSLLGLYEAYLRPHVGTGLSDTIDRIKVYLDEVMPAQ
nr:apolipoprotein A-II [Nothobranchius furzeri]